EVAEVEQLEDPEVTLAQRILADVDLDPRPSVGDHDEVRFAEAADAEDAPRGARLDLRAFELLAGRCAVRGHDRLDRLLHVEAPRIRIDAELDQLLEVGAPLDDLV